MYSVISRVPASRLEYCKIRIMPHIIDISTRPAGWKKGGTGFNNLLYEHNLNKFLTYIKYTPQTNRVLCSAP